MKKYLYVIASLLLSSGIAYAYYGGSSGVMTDTNCNQAQYFNLGVLCQDADDGKLYKGTGSAIEQIQAYDADLDTWAGISPSTDMQAFLGAANDTAARTELGLGTLATQNADNASVTNLTASGVVDVTGATWKGVKPTFVDGSSSADLTVAQVSSTIIGNPTQSGNVTHVLPAIEAGLGFDAILGLTAAFYFRLDPNANDSIYLDGVSCGDGKYIGLTTVTVGDAISCRAMKTGASSYDWACYTAKGAFTCE